MPDSPAVRWGVLSTAKIARLKVIPAMRHCPSAEVTAIASRCIENGQAAAAELGLSRGYGSYEALLDDPDVDAVYIPLPNDLHVPWSVRALRAGKHVLCEKPVALSAEQAEELKVEADRHPELKIMEAFMYRFHPQWIRAKDLVDDGAVGELRSIQSFFSYFNRDPGDIRNNVGQGGGALMDIGCYNISLSRWLVGAEPRRVLGRVEDDPDFGVDRVADGLLDFGPVTSTFTCSTQLVPYQRVHLFGTTGRVELEIPFNAPPDAPCVLWHQTGGDAPVREELAVSDQYTVQGELFSRCVLDDTPVPTPLTDAVANLRVIEALRASQNSGGWVTP